MSDHKSFLKWAGGKIKLLPKLRELGIESGKRFIEPFVGSGVVSLNMPHPELIMADTNPALIALWCQIRFNKNVVKDLGHYFDSQLNHEDTYYKLRNTFNYYNLKSWNEREVARLFLYLNKHCFNGLCRFNAKGEFNVPYNHRKTAPSYPISEIQHAVEVSKRMAFPQHCSFTEMFEIVKKGDMVYCDPPYSPLTADSFVDYSKGGFGFEEHVKLRDLALLAKTNGATVIISNNNTEETRRFYKDADEVHFIDVQKNISCKGDGRTKQSEIIAVYRPK